MIIITPYHAKLSNPSFKNRQQYFLKTLESVNNCGLEKFIHIIVDDGSDDGFCADLKTKDACNNRIWLFRSKKQGEILTCTNALNFGISYLQEKYTLQELREYKCITFLHSDDLAINFPRREKVLTEGDADFVYTDALIFFNNAEYGFKWSGLSYGTKDQESRIWVEGKMPYPTMTWSIDMLLELIEYNSSKYNQCSLLDPNVGCGEDVDAAMTTLEFCKAKNKKVIYLEEITQGYRIHNESLAEIRDQAIRAEEENSVLVKHFGKLKAKYLHLQRFISRPAVYIPQLMKLQNSRKEKIEVEKYINSKL